MWRGLSEKRGHRLTQASTCLAHGVRAEPAWAMGLRAAAHSVFAFNSDAGGRSLLSRRFAGDLLLLIFGFLPARARIVFLHGFGNYVGFLT